MGLYLPNRSKYGVASAPGTSTSITLGTLVPGFLPLPNAASGFPVVYYAEDTIGGSAVVEIGDATLTLSGSTWTLSNRNPYEQSNGTMSLLSLTSAALIGFSIRAGDFFGLPGGFVNRFRNPIMDIWQRGTSITVTTSGAYTADGWIVTPTGASVTVTQDSSRSNPDNLLALKINGAASVTNVSVVQRIESFVAAPLANQTCTVRFKIYNSTGASMTPALKIDDASAGVDSFSSVSADLASTNLQACANGAWTDIAYTFVANANAIKGMQISLFFGAIGSGSYVEVTAADIRLTPFVATGLCATPPLTEKRPVHAEMAFCQRYLYSTYKNGVTPGSAMSIGMVETGFNYSGVWSMYFTFTFPVEMASAPAISYWDNAGNPSKLTQSPSTGGFGPVTNNVTGVSSLAAAISTTSALLSGLASPTGAYYANFIASAEL